MGSGRATRWRALLGALTSFLLVSSLACTWREGTEPRPDWAGPLPPEDALASFELEPGYRIELVASEPLIADPVAIAFDERGRLYVVESRGYPDPLDPEVSPPREGVIALLEDTNGDGRYDRRTDFAGDLTYPNGIMVWDGGIFVSCAPDLIYFKDTDGDGRADLRKVVLTGFAADRTAQIRFSHPTLGWDGWIYLTSGLNGGEVTVPERPDLPPVEFTRSDSRFHPRTLEFELAGGQGQYGLTFDDFGRRFICSNRHPVWHVVLEPDDLQRNPHLAFSQTVQEVSKVESEAVVWPISPDRTTASFIPDLMSRPHAGTFTAASGVHIHRGDALPEGHLESIFICESAQNLVQRQVRFPEGATFASRPARQEAEFLASRDSWFSPVFAANGPDGALYIVDMYRKNIDHPQYIPEPSRSLLDFDAGKGYGRIYRLMAEGKEREKGASFDLGKAGVEELCALLEHPNAWWRETAQRLLVERRDSSVVPHLKELVQRGRSERARVHALWTLENLGALEEAQILRGLQDPHSGVRENAVRLAQSRLNDSTGLLSRLLEMGEDADARVRFQLVLALGETRHPEAVDVLARIARRDGAHLWTRVAVLTSVAGREDAFFRAFSAPPSAPTEVRAAVMQDLGQVFGAGQAPRRCLELIHEITAPGNDFVWQPAAVAGIAEGLDRRGLAKGDRSALMSLVSGDTPAARLARDRLEALLKRCMEVAADEGQPEELRLSAIRLLGHGDYSATGRFLESLLEPRHAAEIQAAAVRALGLSPRQEVGKALVEAKRWQAYTPRLKETVLSVLMSQSRHLPALLGAIEEGGIPPTALNPSRRNQLMRHRDEGVRQRAEELFSGIVSGDRMQVYEEQREKVLALTGNPQAGGAVFELRCGTCHAFAGGDGTGGHPGSPGTGSQLGPDLSGIGNHPAETILLHTLVPDYEITPGYDAYLVETTDGRNLFGLLASEAANSITLRDASGQEQVILRSEIASMSASPHSLMPAELEKLVSEQELADLIAYLKQGAARHLH